MKKLFVLLIVIVLVLSVVGLAGIVRTRYLQTAVE